LPDDFFVDLGLDSGESVPLQNPQALDNVEDLNQLLKASGGNISHLARQLGVSRNTLYKRLRALP
ncbi:helix-turn-helix domain-containing protein, partial [Pseudomonas gingeri]